MPDVFSDKLSQKYKEILGSRTLYENALYLTIIEKPDLLEKSQQNFSKKKSAKSSPKRKLSAKAQARNEQREKQRISDAARLDARMLRKLDEKSSLLSENLSQYGVRVLGKDTSRGGLLSEPLSCLLYTSPSPRDGLLSRMPSSA